jgi:hypothetical protein
MNFGPSTGKSRNRQPRLLGRKQEIDLQLEPFKVHTWLIVIIIPFGPLFLDLNGFYHFPLQKSVLKSIGQIGPALHWLGVLIAACTVFFRFNVNSRSVLISFGLIVLLIKEEVDFIRTSIARPIFDLFGSQPMLVFRSTPDLSWSLLIKRSVCSAYRLILPAASYADRCSVDLSHPSRSRELVDLARLPNSRSNTSSGPRCSGAR